MVDSELLRAQWSHGDITRASKEALRVATSMKEVVHADLDALVIALYVRVDDLLA